MKRGTVDLSSVIWVALLGGKDGEYGKWVTKDDGKEVLINSAAYGYEGAVTAILDFMKAADLVPHQLLLVKEGMNSKQVRSALHPAYKFGRDKVPEQYIEFEKCREMVIDAFTSVGASAVWQDGVEADDVLGYLAQRLQGDVVVMSGDKDLAVLVGGRVRHYRAGVFDANPFGDFPHHLIQVYIALVGDPSDKISGAPGFGAKAWEKVYAAFGNAGLEIMLTLIREKRLAELAEDVGDVPELQKVIDGAAAVYLSYELGRLMVERVNTLNKPLQWRVGMVKPREGLDSRLRRWGGIVKLVHRDNYAAAVEWAREQILASPFVTLDVETSTPAESDEWIRRLDKDEGKEPVDVLGSKLTSLQMTFGANLNFTVYLPVDNVEEPDVKNLTVEQVLDFVRLVPRDKVTWVHNAQFEMVVMKNTGDIDAGDELHRGFLPNVRDSMIASSYVDENRSRGLKGLSQSLLNYTQTAYNDVTTREYVKSEWGGAGEMVAEFIEGEIEADENGEGASCGIAMVRVQHKMNELTARQVLRYGADDCICTAALAVHFVQVMEIEKTLDVFEQVETYPAYLTALAFIQGTNFSLEHMAGMEREDATAYDEAWPKLRGYLIKLGFAGTVRPVMITDQAALAYLEVNDVETLPQHMLEYSARGIKAAVEIVLESELTTQVRTPSKLSKLVSGMVVAEDVEGRRDLLAAAIETKDLDAINSLIAAHFSGEPTLDLNSPKQLAHLLYDMMGLPVRIIGEVTDVQREKDPDLVDAVKKFKAVRAGRAGVSLNDRDRALLRKKAKADESAVDFALTFDADMLDDGARAALKALGVMKKVLTRRNLFYKNYWVLPHWKDGKIHASANQCAAVTRRYSMSNPNLTQLPKTKDGAKFRGGFKPHKKNAVVCSIDFVAQELRLAAWRSQDKNMMACYVGDNLKDIHSLTAAGAIGMKWGEADVARLFAEFGSDLVDNAEGRYTLFCRLREQGVTTEVGKLADVTRKSSKQVNFSAQNGAGAAKISEIEVMPFTDAQLFLDAREEMLPGVRIAADKSASLAQRTGHGYTLMGGIRHLAKSINSADRGEAGRAARQAWSMEIQGSAAEMTKLAMSRLWTSGAYFKYDARFIAPVHDEIVDSVSAEDAVEFIKLKHWCMTQPYGGMGVPILGSISIGPDYHKQIECGDWFIEDRIRATLNDIFTKKETSNV